ncbi:hypothetical protein HN419_02610 [Candidatus Woesearchaeota archaeon]|jgi:hypothetical protein|nr:hypothetical protein [Candidatus Woesearchaeota archaeon]MBT3537111.1 hypothetical protein [Candidatus Woesearchaeota archaeon]MBT4716460.1 hypothetical protein [Candidatus Woesearchaeota archaeon]MBT7106579.1 hypothetical protein [Candidatus Woesearchaeota archaeon]MBT7931046.1 hypothetical protein [Candidatus Woesearchaeota archaeon]
MFGFIKLEDVRRYVVGRFPELVKSDDDGQETRLSLADYVSGAVKVVAVSVTKLTTRVAANETALKKSNGEGRGWVQADMVQLRERAGKVETRVGGIESRLDRSGVVSGVVEPKGEVTFDDLVGFATDVADEGYGRLKNYFLHELARRGYENRRPDFNIFDRDSGLAVSLSLVDSNGRYKRTSGDRTEGIWVDVSKFPSEFNSVSNERALLSVSTIYNSRDYLKIEVEGSRSYDANAWADRLNTDLGEFYKAYMFGSVMRSLDNRQHDVAVTVQKVHGLEEHGALATRMKEIIAGGDANLANAVATHYGED